MFVLRIYCCIPGPTVWWIFPSLYPCLAFGGQRWRDNNEASRTSRHCRSQMGKHIRNSVLAGGCRVLLSELGWKLIFGCRLLMDAVELLPTDAQKPVSSGYNEKDNTSAARTARWAAAARGKSSRKKGQTCQDNLFSPIRFSYSFHRAPRRWAGGFKRRAVWFAFLGDNRMWWVVQRKVHGEVRAKVQVPPLTRCCWNHFLLESSRLRRTRL